MNVIETDVLIIGAGPAGLYAAYYAGFRGFSATLLDVLPEAGGQITAMYPEKMIYDVAGFPAIKGRDLIDGLMEQAGAFHPTYILGERAESLVTTDDNGATVITDQGTTIHAKAVVITGGIGSFTSRELPAGSEFLGKGLVNFVPRLEEHRDKDVVIVGGGDSAFDWAHSLHNIARSIKIVHRRDTFRAHAASIELVRELGIELITDSEVSAISGGDHVESVTIVNKAGESRTLIAQTVVAALGFIANIGPINEWTLDLEKRKIVVDTHMHTNLPRIYAAGDIATYPGKVALISVGFGEAATAINNAVHDIDDTQGVFPGHSSGGAE